MGRIGGVGQRMDVGGVGRFDGAYWWGILGLGLGVHALRNTQLFAQPIQGPSDV